MLKNYLLASIRSLKKKKGFTILNVTGLAVGIASALLIFSYVQFEFSYDQFHENADNIYRVELDQYKNGELIFASSENYPGAAPAIMEEIPEVIGYARLYNLGSKNNMVVSREDAPGGPINIKTSALLYADSSFLNLFSYEMVLGDPLTALSEPYQMVISASTAKKYFGDENPIGKRLRMRDDDFNNEDCEITGVVRDSPQNTHLKFDYLISYKTLFARGEWAPGRYDLSWQRKDMYTYILAKEGTTIESIESKLPEIINKYNPDLQEQDRRDVMLLQPLKSIHLYSNLTDEVEANGNGEFIKFLLIIGFFILVIAWVNYINLSTAKAMERAGEVGIRKTVGATKNQLFFQFMTESFIINLLATSIALLIIYGTLPLFENYLGMQFTPGFLTAGWFLGFVFGIVLFGAFMSGLYPSLVLASYRPSVVLKGKMKNSGKGNFLRKALVVFQFSASVFLIAGTLLIYKQLRYMNNQDLGYNIEQTIVIQRPGVVERDWDALRQKYDELKNGISQISSVNGVAGSYFLPGKKLRFKADVKKYGTGDDELHSIAFTGMDYDLIDQLDMEILAGRAFSREYTTDADTAILITASTAELLGFESPEDAVGKSVVAPSFDYTRIVVGVLKDYHQESLQVATQPTLFFLQEFGLEYNLVKINTGDLQNTLSQINAVWDETFPGNPFDYFFLDEYFGAQYRNEQNFAGLFSFFAVLAIFIGCLGLFGLSAFTAQQRTKEIGVRKVMGSSVEQIVFLLNKDFLKLILIAFVLAGPVCYLIMSSWLEGFAYKIAFDFTLLLVAGGVVLLIAFLTVSIQTLKAARINPSMSLREN